MGALSYWFEFFFYTVSFSGAGFRTSCLRTVRNCWPAMQFVEHGLERIERLRVFEKRAADDVMVGGQRNFEFVFLLVEFGVFHLRKQERLVDDLFFPDDGNRHLAALHGDLAALGDEFAGLHDFADRECQQRETADHEDDRDGRRAEDAHAADADAERIDQRYDDHAGADGQRRDRAAERIAGGVIEFLHFL